MKILAIRGKNIASLEGEFEVDFTSEPLASANIFAISGPTGAGKSSLLDTMCLALFSRTPRTDQAKELNVRLKDISAEALAQNDPRFLLRRGSATGYAETDFVALNGHRYRARWSVGRAKEKESGRLQSPRHVLINLDKETEEQGTRTELLLKIVELIGLSFEQFTRSVLLAQNDFSTFLKAEQGEKAALLEKLTGTELYSHISKRIYEKNSEAKIDYERIQDRISGVELLTEEEEKSLKEQHKEIVSRLKVFEQDKKEWSTLNEAVNSTQTLLNQKENEKQAAEEGLNRSEQILNQAKIVLETNTKEAALLEQAYKNLQPQLREARRLDNELVNAGKLLSENEKRLKEAENKRLESKRRIANIDLAIQENEAEKATIEKWFVQYKDKERIASQLPSLLLHLDMAERAQTAITKSLQDKAKAEKESNNLVEQTKKIDLKLTQIQEGIKQLESSKKDIENELNKIDIVALDEEKKSILSQREQLLQEQLLFSSAGHDAKELRAKLTENTPCPVCGSTVHPYASKEVHEKMQQIQLQIVELTAQSNTIDKRLGMATDQRKLLDKLREQIVVANKNLTDTEKERSEITSSVSLLQNRILQLDESKVGYQNELDRALTATDQLFEGNHWQNNWKENPESFRQRLISFVEEWQKKEKRVQEIIQKLSGLKSEHKTYIDFFNGLEKEWSAAQEAFDKQNQFFQELKQKRNILIDGKDADTVENKQLELIEQKKKEVENMQRTLTEQAGIAEQTRGQKDQIAKDLNLLTESLAKAKSAFENWLNKYHESSEGLLPETRWSKAVEEKSALEVRLQTHEANLKKVAGLKEEAKAKQEVYEQWSKLNELAGSADGGKFRKIAQSYTLDLLLSYANVQLQSLTNRYRLERVPDTLALQVIDREMCDEIRTVHSLSGGESFLVSLALALGLSSLSSNRMKVESLFIDEGFGSLDAETLRIAMDALENLRTQGRKIGVISHVQEMTERIHVQIRVNRLGSGRSKIEII